MVRHAGHGDSVVPLGPARQRNPEQLRGEARVVVEELVEIAQAKKEQRVLRLRLGFVVLAQHRGDCAF